MKQCFPRLGHRMDRLVAKMGPGTSTTTDGLPTPQRYWAALAIALAVMAAVLDGAIANVALPALSRELRASPADTVWVVNAYQLTITVTLLSMASLGEIIGYRRVYRLGLAVFTLASAACALSGSLPMLVAARVLQGLGAAGLMGVNVALVRFIYPQRQLGRGIGINAMVVATSAAVGPSLASAVLALGPWPWLFAINLPIGAAAFLAARTLPETPRRPGGFDWPAALLNAATFGLLIAAIDGIAHGQAPLLCAAEALAALLAGWALVRRELGRPAPLLPVDLLRLGPFALAIATSICSFVAQMLAFVSLPFHLQHALGFSQVETGLLMTPWPAAVALAAPVAGRLADRHPPGLLGGIGLAVLALGLCLLATLPAEAQAGAIAWRMAVCGLGFGLFQSPNNRAILTAAPRERSGGAGGMLSMARLLGQTTGAALVALLLGRLDDAGSRLALLLALTFAALGALTSMARLAPARIKD